MDDKKVKEQEEALKEVTKPQLRFLADSLLSVEKERVAIQVRQSHLALSGRVDPDTNKVRELLENVEDYLTGRVAEEIIHHPAHSWFSRVKGIGDENIAKVVCFLDINKAATVSAFWKYAGFHVVNVTVSAEEQMKEVEKSIDGLEAKLKKLRKKAQKKASGETAEGDDLDVMTEEVVSGLIDRVSEKLDSEFEPEIRSKAPKRTPGQKLEYNSELRVMCFRVASSLLKAQGKFAEYYYQEKRKYESRYRARGIKIVPTLQLPTVNGKIFEPIGTISAAHVHMQAQRKMIKLFLSCLWQAWREAEGLPTRNPYVLDKFPEHTHLISCWDMVDRPLKKVRGRRLEKSA